MATSRSVLAGRLAIVTGASRGIGAATARALAHAGAHRRQRPGVGAAARRAGTGAYGRLDAAVNNAAGGGHRPTTLADVAVADYDAALPSASVALSSR